MNAEQQEQDYRKQLERWQDWLHTEPVMGWFTDGGEEVWTAS